MNHTAAEKGGRPGSKLKALFTRCPIFKRASEGIWYTMFTVFGGGVNPLLPGTPKS